MLDIGPMVVDGMEKVEYEDGSVYVGGWRDEKKNGWGRETNFRDKNNGFPFHFQLDITISPFVMFLQQNSWDEDVV